MVAKGLKKLGTGQQKCVKRVQLEEDIADNCFI